jgi:hypothetical protein
VRDETFERGWSLIEALLRENKGRKLSRKQIYNDWLERRKPDRSTLWRWLDRAVALRRLRQEGGGFKSDPYRYWLPGDKAEWTPDLLDFLDSLTW